MRKHFQQHKAYYAFVFLVQGLGLLAIFLAKGQRDLQILFLVMMAGFYILWGLVHHYIHHDLHTKIVLEYVLMGSVAIALTFFLLR